MGKEELSDNKKDVNSHQLTSILNGFEIDELTIDMVNNAFQRIDVLCTKVKTLEIEIERILTHLGMKTNKEAYHDIKNKKT